METTVEIKHISNGFTVEVSREVTELGEDDREIYFATYVEALEYAIERLGRYVDQQKAIKVKGLS